MNPYLFLYSVFIGTASIVCGAGSTKRYGVRLSVCLSAAWLVGVEFNALLHTIYKVISEAVSAAAAAGLLLWSLLAGNIDRLLRERRCRRTQVAEHRPV